MPGGAVYDNTISVNAITGNGLADVTIHSFLPGQDFAGNHIITNDIGTNNLGGDFGDPDTTGVYLGSVGPQNVTVAFNVIHGNHFGIFTAGPVTVVNGSLNLFFGDAIPFGSTPVYTG
ncbi:MAG: hypothetical protein ABSH04_06725 [Acidimicrobiales bacterium]